MSKSVLRSMTSSLVKRQRIVAAPLALGVAFLVGFPTVSANQDIAAMISGQDGGAVRWNGYVKRQTPDSIESVDLPFRDGLTTGSVSLASVGGVSLKSAAKGKSRIPDEDRVVGAMKRARIMQIAPVAPPRAFSAGSILQRTSLLRPTVEDEQKLAFIRPTDTGKEIQIASVFQLTPAPVKDETPSYLTALINNKEADILASAYAPTTGRSSPFASLLNEGGPNNGRFIPPMQPGDHAWMRSPLPATVFTAKEQTCLANAIYYEARGESAQGQAAVAQVVLNRVRNPAYPKSICGVVYQNQHMYNSCQFSFACDGIRKRVDSPASYKKAREIAMAVTAGKIFIPEVGSATHYYAQYVNPGWARAMDRMTKIGMHIFYRTKKGGWS